jgi:hypothetical protein
MLDVVEILLIETLEEHLHVAERRIPPQVSLAGSSLLDMP